MLEFLTVLGYYTALAFWITFGATIGYLTARELWAELDRFEKWLKRQFVKEAIAK